MLTQDGFRVSPRLRGWTQRARGRWPGLRGFPAPAGMDPAPRPGPRPGRRFPRACGDGPLVGRLDGFAERVSPRLRGWTHHADARRCGGHGFPVPAMDLASTRDSIACRRFPRACGDGPVTGMVDYLLPVVSPRLRGWTCHDAEQHLDHSGFPAPAGMDPAGTRARNRRVWFPRACGDGPVVGNGIDQLTTVSPRLRGWTPVSASRMSSSVGFPAPAGMDLSPSPPRRRKPRFPRACGDGPIYCSERNITI